MVKKLGNVDSPVKEYSRDKLSLESQIDGLATFIRNCETPMTISIQGTWGSGKTSFFNMVKDRIVAEDKKNDCVFEEFNSWQFVQFDMSEQLAANMIIALTNALYKSTPDERREEKNSGLKIINGLEGLKAGTRLVGNIVNGVAKNMTGVDVKEHLNEAGFFDSDKMLNKKEERQKTAVEIVSELKKDFQDVVRNRLGIDDKHPDEKKRVIFFVDDLDRLSPDKAIEVLEVLKMFLDCEHCVFVLAIDYNVVVNGVALKYKNSISAEKGVEFFEKMIQVVYTLPDTLSHTDRYIAEILRNNGKNISLSHEFADLVKSGKRDNPRAIKRLMNSYLLLEEMRSKASSRTMRQDENILLFAVLCLQNICPEVYNYLYEKFSFPYDYDKGTRWLDDFKIYCYVKYYELDCEPMLEEKEFAKLVLDGQSGKLNQIKLGFLNTFFEKLSIGKYASFEDYDINKCITIGNVLNLEKAIKLTEITKVNDNSYSDNDSVALVRVRVNDIFYTVEGTIDEAYKETISRILSEVVHKKDNEQLFSIFDDFVDVDYEELVDYFADFLSMYKVDDNWEQVTIKENDVEIYVKMSPDDATTKVKNVKKLSEHVKVSFVWYSDVSGTKKLVEGYDFIEDAFGVGQLNFGSIYYVNMGNENIFSVKDRSIKRAYYETIFSIMNAIEDEDLPEKVINQFDFLEFENDDECSYDEDLIGEEKADDFFYEKYGEWRWAAKSFRDSQMDYYIRVDGLSDDELIKNVRELAAFCKVNFWWYGDPYMKEIVLKGFDE